MSVTVMSRSARSDASRGGESPIGHESGGYKHWPSRGAWGPSPQVVIEGFGKVVAGENDDEYDNDE